MLHKKEHRCLWVTCAQGYVVRIWRQVALTLHDEYITYSKKHVDEDSQSSRSKVDPRWIRTWKSSKVYSRKFRCFASTFSIFLMKPFSCVNVGDSSSIVLYHCWFTCVRWHLRKGWWWWPWQHCACSHLKQLSPQSFFNGDWHLNEVVNVCQGQSMPC